MKYTLPNYRTPGAILKAQSVSFFNPEAGLRAVPGVLAGLLGAVRADLAAILALDWLTTSQKGIEAQEIKRTAYDASKALQGLVTQATIKLRAKTAPADIADGAAAELRAQRSWARAKEVLEAGGDVWESILTANTVQDVVALRQELPAWLLAHKAEHRFDPYRAGGALAQALDAHERTLMTPAELTAANRIDGIALGIVQVQNALDLAVSEFAGDMEFPHGWTVLPGYNKGESVQVPVYKQAE